MGNIKYGIMVDYRPDDIDDLTNTNPVSHDHIRAIEAEVLGTSAELRAVIKSFIERSDYLPIDTGASFNTIKREIGLKAKALVDRFNDAQGYDMDPSRAWELMVDASGCPLPQCIRYEWVNGEIVCHYNYAAHAVPPGGGTFHIGISLVDHYNYDVHP